MKFSTSIAIIALVAMGCQSEQDETIEADWLIADVTLIDVADGSTVENAFVAISEDKIDSIYAKKVVLADTTKVVPGSGKFLMPGLWDMHAHVSFNHRYQQGLLIANGVVGVREMWGQMNIIDSIREEVAKGTMIAPEIYSSGAIIGGDPPYWPGSDAVANAEDAKRVLQQQADQGVDFFKIYSLLSKEAYLAIAEESKRLGIPFGGHVPESVSLFEAIDAGQATTEHLMKFIPACSAAEDELDDGPGLSTFEASKIDRSLETFSEDKYNRLVSKLVDSDTWLVPTLVTKRGLALAQDTVLLSTNPKNNPLIAYMPEHTVATWASMPTFAAMRFGEGFFEANKKRFEKEMSLIGDMQRKGVKFLAGTDYANPFCYPGFSIHQELRLMVDAGMSNLAALQTATYNPALFLERENEGTVANGNVANMVLLNSNPLDDIANTEEISAVFLQGDYFNRSKLDSLMEDSKLLVKQERNDMIVSGGMPYHFHEMHQ